MKDKVIVVAGPTCTGKSKFAIDLAKKFNGEIVSLDSVQVYKYLDIGSAKVTKEEMEGIPHYMLSLVEPNVNLNVEEFKKMADKYIEDILRRKKLPILVGGTGFYIRAILYDTDFLEEDENIASEIRKNYYSEYEKNGIDNIYKKLLEVDRKSAETIEKGNDRRIIRALEFYDLHNMPISKHNEIEKNKKAKYDNLFFVLNEERNILYDRINLRVDKMFELGLIEEVKHLISLGVNKDNNSMKSIGYRELYDYVFTNDDSEEKLKTIKEDIKKHTRNYAKRQLTWFRGQKNILWTNKNDNVVEKIKIFLSDNIDK